MGRRRSVKPEASAAEAGEQVVVVGIDDSEHSYHALQWTLQHLFASAHRRPPPSSLVVVHAMPSATSLVGLSGPDVLPLVESELNNIAEGALRKAWEICRAKPFQLCRSTFKMEEGDARDVLCEAVEKHQATMLVLGSRGYGAIKSRKQEREMIETYHLRKRYHQMKAYPHNSRKQEREAMLAYVDMKNMVVLGSVGDYCAHHAHCTIMRVKK